MKRQPRLTRSITTKITQVDYERLEAQAGTRNVSEWARDALLTHVDGPNPFQAVIMEEVQALRYILINGVIPPSQALRDLVEAADQRKAETARKVLTVKR